MARLTITKKQSKIMNIDAYIASASPEVCDILKRIRQADKWYQHYRARLRKFGTPFGGPTRCQEEEPLMQDCKSARAFDPST